MKNITIQTCYNFISHENAGTVTNRRPVMIENPRVSLFNRNGILYVQFYLNGKLKQKSLKKPYTKENVRLAKKHIIPQIEKKILLGEISDTNETAKNFEFYVDIYLKQKEQIKSYQEYYNIVIHQLIPIFKNRKISTIKRGEIKAWIDERLQTITPKRMRQLLGILSAIFEIAVEYEHIQINPVKNIKLPHHKTKKEMKPFTKEEVAVLLENAKGQFKNYLAIAFYTGMRPGEIIALTISDIDFENKTININKRIRKGVIGTPKTKNSIRKIPLMDELKPYLEEQVKIAKDKKTFTLFTTKNAKPYYSSDKLHKMWYDLLKKCNIKKRVMYNTRHTFATQAIKSNLPIYIVSQILGHKNVQETLTTYAKFINNEHLQIDRHLAIFTNNVTDSSSKKAK